MVILQVCGIWTCTCTFPVPASHYTTLEEISLVLDISPDPPLPFCCQRDYALLLTVSGQIHSLVLRTCGTVQIQPSGLNISISQKRVVSYHLLETVSGPCYPPDWNAALSESPSWPGPRNCHVNHCTIPDKRSGTVELTRIYLDLHLQ